MTGLEVDLTISSLDGLTQIDIERAWTVPKIPISRRSLPTTDGIKKWPHLEGIEFPALNEQEITILIGSNVPEAFWQDDDRRGNYKEPYAVKSPLGWTVIGPSGTKENSANHGTVNFTRVSSAVDSVELLHKQVEQMWKHDFNDGNFQVRLLW